MHRRRPPARRAVPTLVLALALALAACGGDDGDDATPSTTTEAAGTTPPTSTTTAPTESTEPASTEPSQPTAFTTEARDAANELLAAWQAGDQARARAIAPGDVVDALFLVPPDGYAVYGCDTGEFDTSGCNWRNRATGGYINVGMQRSEAGWQVATVDVGQD